MNGFETIFEISLNSNGYLSDFLFRIGIGLVATIGAIIWMVKLSRTLGSLRRDWIGPIFFLVWGIIWLGSHLSIFWNYYQKASSLVRIYRDHKASVVEGVVSTPRLQPHHGHSSGDRVRIGDKEFEVNYFYATPGYHITVAHGGVLKSGAYARLTYHDGVILKVEIRKKPN